MASEATEVEIEAVARELDPGAWEADLPIPTRAATIAFHHGRRTSCDLARAAIVALDKARSRV